jgi:hypothetical protein
MRLLVSARIRHLALARLLGWTSLNVPGVPLVRLLHSARTLLFARSVNRIPPQCLKYQESPLLVRLLGSARIRSLVMARLVGWTSLNVPGVPLLLRSLGSVQVRRLVLRRSVDQASVNDWGAPLRVRSSGSVEVPRLVCRSVNWGSLNLAAMQLPVRLLYSARGLVLARSVKRTRLNYVNSLPAQGQAQFVGLLGALHLVRPRLPRLNPPTTPLVMLSAESAWPLVLDRLDCVNPLP